MLIILTYTVLFWMLSVALGRFVLIGISEGNMFDVIFGWQNMLNNLYASKSKALNLLGKFLGDCDACLFHHVTIWCFVMYYLILTKTQDIWITSTVESAVWTVIINIIWYIVFVTIGWFLSFKINSK